MPGETENNKENTPFTIGGLRAKNQTRDLVNTKHVTVTFSANGEAYDYNFLQAFISATLIDENVFPGTLYSNTTIY
jgi:hypothetical protein